MTWNRWEWKRLLHRAWKRRPKGFGTRSHSQSCTNRGSCPWCRGNRLASTHRRIDAATEQQKECDK